MKSFISVLQTRDIPDSRLRGTYNTYNRGGRGASDRYTGSSHFSSTGINFDLLYTYFNHRIHAYYVFQVLETSRGNLQTRKRVEPRVTQVLGLLPLEWQTTIRHHTGFPLPGLFLLQLGVWMQIEIFNGSSVCFILNQIIGFIFYPFS